MKTGFIGLGKMGAGMASRLCQAGYELTVYNRSAERMQPLIAAGARAAKNIAEVCDADVVFTMLANDAALSEVTLGPSGILEHLKPGAIHVSCSTVSVALSAQLAEAHREKQQGFIAAPVFGRPDAAAAGKLFMVAAGKPELIAKIQPLLDILGQRTFIVSDDPEKANLVKLSGNFLIATVIESLGEAMALVEKGGVDRHQYLDLLTSSIFNVPLYKNYGGMIADRHFEPAGFAAHLGQKDMRLVLAAAEDLKVPLPFASILRDRFLDLAAHGGDNLDWSAVGSLAAKDAAIISG
ncbi:3-hydroxyisobutyrate dehydrogenase and related beta-hydroxyacid dehydrogenases [Sulfuriferula multivorans]|uniref:3-hydroxyisobutyrate dehydrogenase and related beta-hydroxyacid dehydrogenases n=2 Tax=Sulfuriferula multivorans TaxID=1559896 RepID=A0A401JBE0_9PROT|nr:3-hydroxyisobutyrate dehydrogenase and related beta-hydroxyacid dehydrogenases [Sulfuriferula multivorans]